MQDLVTYIIGKSVLGHEHEASETNFVDSRVMQCDEIYSLFFIPRNAGFDLVKLERGFIPFYICSLQVVKPSKYLKYVRQLRLSGMRSR